MKYSVLLSTMTTALALGIASQPASAIEKGDWIVRFGVVNVSPNDSSDASNPPGIPADAITVDSDTQLYIDLTYMFTDNLGLDILGATPFTHDIALAGVGKVAETQQLPPTVGLQYQFSPKSNVRPYAGVGINYTFFFNEETTGALAGADLSLDDSLGLALQAGVDIDINKDWFFNADVRYMNIETTATINGATSVDVTIDPWVIGLGIGTTF